MNLDEAKKLNEYKEKVQEETRQELLKTIKISDSYLYAKIAIFKSSQAIDPFVDKVEVRLSINLYNSSEFSKQYMENSPRRAIAKVINSVLILDSYKLISQKEDAMMLVYDEVAKEIAKDLFSANANNIDMVVSNRQERL